jgi:DNA (cytosine-5)-methyltransferase 1
MKYGSVCSGVEAATVAWHDLGWEPQFFSEFDEFPSAVLKNHYPDVPNYGDMTKYKDWNLNDKSIDLLVGGTPCQSFSISGLRKGLHDDRGNLMLEYLRMADELKPKWIVWENVVGVLSSNKGRDFGTFLTALGEIGYGFAYRVLDAQYFGVPQRRRRVFVVGCLGDWRSAGKVLFKPDCLSGDPPPSRAQGERIAPTVTTGPPFSRTGNERVEAEALVTYRKVSHGEYTKDQAASTMMARDYKDATDLITFSPQNSASNGLSISEHTVPTLQTKKQSAVVIDRAAFNQGVNAKYDPLIKEQETIPTLVARGPHAIQQRDMKVRRLTPRECERLQGFPDDWTRIQWKGKKPEECPDGHRYKAMGNSMAVPVMRWIGQQIKQVEEE